FFMYLFPKITQGWSAPPMDFSVAVWVGFIACFGMATETGIIMLVYLREAIEKRGGLENIGSLEELRQAVIEGAVQRLRPKLLTEGVAIIAIFPMVFATGVGGEILAPMALPVLGGLLISDEVVDLFLPVRFYWVRRARWLKLHGDTCAFQREIHEGAVFGVGAADFGAIIICVSQKNGRRAGGNFQAGPRLVLVLCFQVAGVAEDREIGPATGIISGINTIIF